MESLKKEYINLHTLLTPYKELWQYEPISRLQGHVLPAPQIWLDQLSLLNDLEHFQFYSKNLNLEQLAHGELKNILLLLEQNEQIEHWTHEQNIHLNPLHLSEKKHHEIRSILPFLMQKLDKAKKPDLFIDIASGHGHLGRLISDAEDFKDLPIYCLEKDEDLILKGEEFGRNQSKAHLHFFAKDLNYQHLKEECSHSLPFINKNQKTLFLGLHTCGNLALSQHLLAFAPTLDIRPMFLNLGCCYLKLHPELETNLSSLAQAHPLSWTPQALTLATRAHKRSDFKEYQKMKRVKFYRYALQIFIQQELNINNLFPVGPSKHRLYEQPFAVYAKEKLKNIEHANIDEGKLQKFYNDGENQQKIREFFIITLLRWRFGRCLEKILMLDRALWAHDHGLTTKLLTIFDESISPRNIALVNF